MTLHYITLHYITLHYITLHYITLHYITLHYMLNILYLICTIHNVKVFHIKYIINRHHAKRVESRVMTDLRIEIGMQSCLNVVFPRRRVRPAGHVKRVRAGTFAPKIAETEQQQGHRRREGRSWGLSEWGHEKTREGHDMAIGDNAQSILDRSAEQSGPVVVKLTLALGSSI